MKFFVLVFRNMIRRPTRVALTVFALAIAVTTYVALVGLSDEFMESAVESCKMGGADLVVLRAGGQEAVNSALDVSLGSTLRRIPGVVNAMPTLADVISFEEYGVYGAGIQGFEADARSLDAMHVIAGRRLRPDDGKAVFLGQILAKNLDKKVGDQLSLYFEDERYEVVGIFQSNNVLVDGTVVVLLSELQRLMDRPDQATGFGITVADPTDEAAIEQVAQRIRELPLGLKALPAKDHVRNISQVRITQAMAWLTASIAVLIGGIGVLNTMFMSVIERTHEIGILRAIGWRKRRVFRMVLWESVFISLVAAVVGSIAAVAMVKWLTQFPLVNGLVAGDIPLHVIGEGFLLAVLVGLAGAAYPAYRGASLPPTEALRHE